MEEQNNFLKFCLFVWIGSVYFNIFENSIIKQSNNIPFYRATCLAKILLIKLINIWKEDFYFPIISTNILYLILLVIDIEN